MRAPGCTNVKEPYRRLVLARPCNSSRLFRRVLGESSLLSFHCCTVRLKECFNVPCAKSRQIMFPLKGARPMSRHVDYCVTYRAPPARQVNILPQNRIASMLPCHLHRSMNLFFCFLDAIVPAGERST